MRLELTVLGSSSALPLSNRNPSSQFLNLSNRQFLIDCGEGTQMQLRRNRIGFSRVNHILISHLHGDHYYGLMPLLTTLNLLDRRKELHLYAPPELEHGIHQSLKLSHSKLKFPLVFHELNFKDREVIYDDRAVRVSSFPLKHSLPCCGFLFEEKQRPRKILKEKIESLGIPIPEIKKIQAGEDWISEHGKVHANSEITTDPADTLSYAYCTDTAPVAHLKDLLKIQPDLLYHEATFEDQHEIRAKDTKHSTARQAGIIAREVDAKQLLIGHFSTRYTSLDNLLAEAREEFEHTMLAKENCTYVLKSGEKLELDCNQD